MFVKDLTYIKYESLLNGKVTKNKFDSFKQVIDELPEKNIKDNKNYLFVYVKSVKVKGGFKKSLNTTIGKLKKETASYYFIENEQIGKHNMIGVDFSFKKGN